MQLSAENKKKSSRKGAKQIFIKTSIALAKGKVNMDIKEKLTAELKGVKLGRYETGVKDAVLRTLCEFCKQNAEFAQAIEQSDKSFDDCLKATVRGVSGLSLEDLEVYKRAVAFYFPTADIKCTMTLDLGDNGFSNSGSDSVERKLSLDLDSLLDF